MIYSKIQNLDGLEMADQFLQGMDKCTDLFLNEKLF